MRDNGFLEPFRALSPAKLREVHHQRMLAKEQSKRHDKVIEAYREIVHSPHYQALREDLEASLGAALQGLVEHARECGNCAKLAVRVDALNDMVARPLHQLWFDAERSRLPQVAEPSEEAIPDAV